jgi:hypothetical protein
MPETRSSHCIINRHALAGKKKKKRKEKKRKEIQKVLGEAVKITNFTKLRTMNS